MEIVSIKQRFEMVSVEEMWCSWNCLKADPALVLMDIELPQGDGISCDSIGSQAKAACEGCEFSLGTDNSGL